MVTHSWLGKFSHPGECQINRVFHLRRAGHAAHEVHPHHDFYLPVIHSIASRSQSQNRTGHGHGKTSERAFVFLISSDMSLRRPLKPKMFASSPRSFVDRTARIGESI